VGCDKTLSTERVILVNPKFEPGDIVKRTGYEDDIYMVELCFDHNLRLYRIRSLKTHLWAMCNEDELQELKPKFKPGDLVKVVNYEGVYKVIESEEFDLGLQDYMYWLMNTKTKKFVYGAEEDMSYFFPRKPKPSRHNKKEYYKYLREETMTRIDEKLDLYNDYGDQRFLDKAKRLGRFLLKIPD
jgi:hypothetical protein